MNNILHWILFWSALLNTQSNLPQKELEEEVADL